jgi:Major Facilitator Superfamily
MRSPESTIRRFSLFAALSFVPLMMPVLVLFWEDNGLDTFDIYLLQAAFSLAMVLLEVPTGLVADQLGKRTSLLAGQLVLTSGFVLYGLGQGFWSFLLAEVVLALGLSLLSGADAALLYDSLKRLGRQGEYVRVEGRAHSVRLFMFALGNAAGGLLGAWSLRATLWASAVGPALAIFVVWGFADSLSAPARGFGEALRATGRLSLDALRFILKHQLVRWVVVFQAVLAASATWLLWTYQPYLSLTGVPVWAFGLAFAAYGLCAALCSRLAERVTAAFGDAHALVLLAVLQVLPPLCMGLFLGPLSFLFVLGHQAARGLSRPILNARILAFTNQDKRATVLSMASLAGRLLFTVTGPIVGWLSARDLLGSMRLQGMVLLGVFVGLAIVYRRIPEKYFQVKAGVG